MTKTTKKRARRQGRPSTKPAVRAKTQPATDALSREEIEAANAAGPGAVAGLIRKAAGAKGKAPAKAKPEAKPPRAAKADVRERDSRLPAPGTTLTRAFNGKEVRVEVLDAGFRYDGKTWRSLSAIAKAVSGTSWNGFLFFGLQKRPGKPASVGKAAPAATAEAK